MDYYDRIAELTCLADIDESRDYEVDMSGIYTDGTKFYFITASGCSCWSGEYDETVYNSFEELKNAIAMDDTSDYAPSLNGVRYLITTAESVLPNPSPKVLDSDSSVLDWLSANFG